MRQCTLADMDTRFLPRPLAYPQSAILSALVANPRHDSASLALELGLPIQWIEASLRADMFQAHLRAIRAKASKES